MFSDKPLLIFWELTKACPLVCIHCRANAITKPLPDELSKNECFKLIDEILNFEKPYPILILTGGDPLQRDDLLEIIEYAYRYGFKIGIAPTVSPKLLNEELIKEFKNYRVSVSISLDGEKEIHNYIRKCSDIIRYDVYDLTIKSIKLLKDYGINVQINTTVMKINIFELPKIISIIKKLSINTWEVFFLIKTGRGIDVEDLQSKEFETTLLYLYLIENSLGITVRTVEAPEYRRIKIMLHYLVNKVEDLDKALQIYSKFLNYDHELFMKLVNSSGISLKDFQAKRSRIVPTRDGDGIIFISANGDIYPSGFAPYKLGNVRKDNIVHIYRNHEILLKIRKGMYLGKCNLCEFKYICGGSRARAFTYTGNILESDPVCIYEPKTFSKIFKFLI